MIDSVSEERPRGAGLAAGEHANDGHKQDDAAYFSGAFVAVTRDLARWSSRLMVWLFDGSGWRRNPSGHHGEKEKQRKQECQPDQKRGEQRKLPEEKYSRQ